MYTNDFKIQYQRPLHFGRFRGMTGRDLTLTKEGRKYIRWAKGKMFVSNFTLQQANRRGRFDFS